MIAETVRRHLVLLISLFLCVGLVATADASVVATSSSLVEAKFTQDSASQLHAFMSQEARNASDGAITLGKTMPPQTFRLGSYKDWVKTDANKDWRNTGWTNPIAHKEENANLKDWPVQSSNVVNTLVKPAHLSNFVPKEKVAKRIDLPAESYSWRNTDWKDPFARNGKRLAASNVSVSDSDVRLELKMPSPTSITRPESFGDLEDPFAPKVAAPEMPDPFEDYNRFMFDFNEEFYDNIMEPVVRGYRDLVNEDVRMAISNIFDNAMAPLKLASSFLQGDLDKTGRVIGRTIINTTIGLGGMFDVADKAFDIKDVNEDLDQTLGSYGVPTGPYVVLPLFGPSNVRNIFGRAGGIFLSPTYHFAPGVEVGVGLTATDEINDTSFIVDDIKQLEDSSIDKYESVRDFYGQYRFGLVNE